MARPVDSNAAETHARLVQTARDCLHERGVEQFSLRSVAKEAGVGLGTLHYYFGDREGLIEACLEDGYRWLESEISTTLRRLVDGASLDDEVERLARVYFRTARIGREQVRLRILSTMERGGLAEERLDGELVRVLERVAALLTGDRHHTGIRMAAQTFELLVARCALRSDDECRAIAGVESKEEAVAIFEDHLVAVARSLFRDGLRVSS